MVYEAQNTQLSSTYTVFFVQCLNPCHTIDCKIQESKGWSLLYIEYPNTGARLNRASVNICLIHT